jgi:hypothetical protein
MVEDFSIVPPPNVDISGPFLGSTRISEIDPLQPLYQLVSARSSGTINPAISSLSRFASGGSEGEPVLNGGSSYYYVGIKKIPDGLSSFSRARSSFDAFAKSLYSFVSDGSSQFITNNSQSSANINKLLNDSNDLAKELSKETSEQIKAELVRSSSSEISTEDSDSQLYDGEFKSFQIRNEARSDLSKTNILKFSGNVDEAKFIASNFGKLASLSFSPESSSVTYSGLVIPNDDPIISSLSVTFSESGEQTSISYSNKEFLGIAENILMAGYSMSTNSSFKKGLKARQKNFLGVN